MFAQASRHALSDERKEGVRPLRAPASTEPVPIREFTDAGQVRWRVWATTPTRGNVRPQFAAGWLTFESPAERRRLAPVPEPWTDLADEALCDFLSRAIVVSRAPAIILQPVQGAPPPAPEPLEGTIARVRAVLHQVDQTLERATG